MANMKSIGKFLIFLLLLVCLTGILIWNIPQKNSCSLEKVVPVGIEIPSGWVIDFTSESINSIDQISKDGITTTYINNDSKTIVVNVDEYINPIQAKMNILTQIRIFNHYYHYYDVETDNIFVANLDGVRIMCTDDDDFYKIKRCDTYLREKNIVVSLGSWIDNDILTQEEYEGLVRLIGTKMVECATLIH